MKATLSKRPWPDGGTGGILAIDCRHATTTGHYVVAEGGLQVTDDVIRVLLVRHFGAEGCACTAALWRKYGLPPELRRRLAAGRN